MKTTNEITLYDLMAEDIDVWLTQSERFGFELQVDDENGFPLVRENIHPYAAESFAEFCRQYLYAYDKASSVEAA